MKDIVKTFLHRYVYEDWNIAIADVSDDLSPVNIRWMKHPYKDRWFADPFIIDETNENYIILAEECRHGYHGTLVRITIRKDDFNLIKNETILDIDTHLSFPNTICVDNKTYVYPENAKNGNTRFYSYENILKDSGVLMDIGLADPIIFKYNDSYYLMATLGDECNGNKLSVFQSDRPLTGYNKIQEIVFDENIARRAGNVFSYKGMLISPAQICTDGYGKGISFQQISFTDKNLVLTEIKRLYPPTKEYPEGFHTYNVWGDKVIIDGYRYGNRILHKLYFALAD